jgi:hypothetical protein
VIASECCNGSPVYRIQYVVRWPDNCIDVAPCSGSPGNECSTLFARRNCSRILLSPLYLYHRRLPIQHNKPNPCIHASTPCPQRPSPTSSISQSHYDLHPAHPAIPLFHLPIDLSYRLQGSLEVGSGWNIGKQQEPSRARVGGRLQPRCCYARGYVYPAASNIMLCGVM